MTKLLPALILLAACGGPDAPAVTPETPALLRVDVFPAKESDVNAYVVSDGTGAILIDATRNSAEARALLAFARDKNNGRDPSLVFITHGHPDHYLGIGALLAEVPGLRVVVASAAIQQDIIGMSTWMAGQGWLDGEPAMKPDVFDYAARIETLDGDRLTLPGGAALEVTSDYPGTEAEHMSTLYAPELGALFTSDLAYHDVHLWMGPGVTPAHADAWKRVLTDLEARYPTDTTVYPGHGAPTEPTVFGETRAYIDAMLAVAGSTASDAEAIDAMVAKYPDHANREFLLMMSVQQQRAEAAK